MGTEKLFWRDPRATRLDGAEVELDRTILFAFSGGQERDEGTIAGRSVLDAVWNDDGTIVPEIAERVNRPIDDVPIVSALSDPAEGAS